MENQPPQTNKQKAAEIAKNVAKNRAKKYIRGGVVSGLATLAVASYGAIKKDSDTNNIPSSSQSREYDTNSAPDTQIMPDENATEPRGFEVDGPSPTAEGSSTEEEYDPAEHAGITKEQAGEARAYLEAHAPPGAPGDEEEEFDGPGIQAPAPPGPPEGTPETEIAPPDLPLPGPGQ